MTTKFCSGCGVKVDKKQKICPICGAEETVEYDKEIRMYTTPNFIEELFSNIRLPQIGFGGPMFTDEQAWLNGCYLDELYKEILKQKILAKNYKKWYCVFHKASVELSSQTLLFVRLHFMYSFLFSFHNKRSSMI